MAEQDGFFGLESDKITILPAHLLCMPLAVLFHLCTRNTAFRKEISAILAVLLVIWCYRWTSVQLLVQWLLSYILYKVLPSNTVGRYTFLITFAHVLLANAYAVYYEYGKFGLDYKSTLMLGTMKMSSFAFSVEDANKKTASLKDFQIKQAIRGEVTLLEHFCYYFSFCGVLFGPFIFYNDHKYFMENRPQRVNHRYALSTMIYGLACAVIYLLAMPDYDVTLNTNEQVLASGFFYRHWILLVTMFLAKCRYYFAWLTAQSVCLFAGYDADESSEDPITETVRPLRIELATSLKEFIDNWNIFTAKWLKFAVHTRVPTQKVLITFLVSAVWHGFYPGYLLMFVPLVFYSIVGQKLYKYVWPRFQQRTALSVSYIIIAWIGTTILVTFNGTAFQLIYFKEIMAVQSRFYFYPHIIAVLLFLLFTSSSKFTSSRSGKHSRGGNGDISYDKIAENRHVNNNGIKSD